MIYFLLLFNSKGNLDTTIFTSSDYYAINYYRLLELIDIYYIENGINY